MNFEELKQKYGKKPITKEEKKYLKFAKKQIRDSHKIGGKKNE